MLCKKISIIVNEEFFETDKALLKAYPPNQNPPPSLSFNGETFYSVEYLLKIITQKQLATSSFFTTDQNKFSEYRSIAVDSLKELSESIPASESIQSMPFVCQVKDKSIIFSNLSVDVLSSLDITESCVELFFLERRPNGGTKKNKTNKSRSKSKIVFFHGNHALRVFSKIVPFFIVDNETHQNVLNTSFQRIHSFFSDSTSRSKCELIDNIISTLPELLLITPQLLELKSSLSMYRESIPELNFASSSLNPDLSTSASCLAKNDTALSAVLTSEAKKTKSSLPLTCTVWVSESASFSCKSVDSFSSNGNPNTLEFYFWRASFKAKVAKGKYFDFCKSIIPSFYTETKEIISDRISFLECLLKELNALYNPSLHKKLSSLPFVSFPDSVSNLEYVSKIKADRDMKLASKKKVSIIDSIHQFNDLLSNKLDVYSQRVFLSFYSDFRNLKPLSNPEYFLDPLFKPLDDYHPVYTDLVENKELFSLKEFSNLMTSLTSFISLYLSVLLFLSWDELHCYQSSLSSVNSVLNYFDLSLDKDFLTDLESFKFDGDPSESSIDNIFHSFNCFISAYSHPIFLPLKAALIEPFLPFFSQDHLLSLNDSFFNPLFDKVNAKYHLVSFGVQAICYRVCQMYFWGTIFPNILNTDFRHSNFFTFQRYLSLFLDSIQSKYNLKETILFEELSFAYNLFEALSKFDDSKVSLSVKDLQTLIPKFLFHQFLLMIFTTKSDASTFSSSKGHPNIFNFKLALPENPNRLLNVNANKLIDVHSYLSKNFQDCLILKNFIIDRPYLLKDSRLRFPLIRFIFVFLINYSEHVTNTVFQQNKETISFLLSIYKKHSSLESNQRLNDFLKKLEEKLST